MEHLVFDKTQLDHEERQEFELSSSIKILSGFMYLYSKPIAYMMTNSIIFEPDMKEVG